MALPCSAWVSRRHLHFHVAHPGATSAPPRSPRWHRGDNPCIIYFYLASPSPFSAIAAGEALQGDLGFGVDPQVLKAVAREITEAHMAGVEVAVVVGGGNYFRGAASAGKLMDRATGDYVGMLATCMNAIMLQSALEREFGVASRVMTAIEMKEVAEPYIRRRAIRHLERGRVVIFGAGTGNPFFTTDTAAALRAAEIGAEVFMKATKVDGVYDSDPMHNPGAARYRHVSYREVMSQGLNVMDATAITLCQENGIPVLVFNLNTSGNVIRAAHGDDVGTLVCNEGSADGQAQLGPDSPPPVGGRRPLS